VLTELSAYAEGYVGSRHGMVNVLAAVPDEHLIAAGLLPREEDDGYARSLFGVMGVPRGEAERIDRELKAELEEIAENERQARRD
jgi:hypothetical protein